MHRVRQCRGETRAQVTLTVVKAAHGDRGEVQLAVQLDQWKQHPIVVGDGQSERTGSVELGEGDRDRPFGLQDDARRGDAREVDPGAEPDLGLFVDRRRRLPRLQPDRRSPGRTARPRPRRCRPRSRPTAPLLHHWSPPPRRRPPAPAGRHRRTTIQPRDKPDSTVGPYRVLPTHRGARSVCGLSHSAERQPGGLITSSSPDPVMSLYVYGDARFCTVSSMSKVSGSTLYANPPWSTTQT